MSIRAAVRLIGSAVILLASAAWGFGRIRAERRKTDELAAFCGLVRYIGENIAHFSRPLPEIYADYSDEVLGRIGFLDALCVSGMEAAVRTMTVTDDEKCGREIKAFASAIGGGYREEQTQLCEYTFSRLSGVLAERRESAKSREKLYRTIPVLIALSVILMLI